MAPAPQHRRTHSRTEADTSNLWSVPSTSNKEEGEPSRTSPRNQAARNNVSEYPTSRSRSETASEPQRHGNTEEKDKPTYTKLKEQHRTDPQKKCLAVLFIVLYTLGQYGPTSSTSTPNPKTLTDLRPHYSYGHYTGALTLQIHPEPKQQPSLTLQDPPQPLLLSTNTPHQPPTPPASTPRSTPPKLSTSTPRSTPTTLSIRSTTPNADRRQLWPPPPRRQQHYAIWPNTHSTHPGHEVDRTERPHATADINTDMQRYTQTLKPPHNSKNTQSITSRPNTTYTRSQAQPLHTQIILHKDTTQPPIQKTIPGFWRAQLAHRQIAPPTTNRSEPDLVTEECPPTEKPPAHRSCSTTSAKKTPRTMTTVTHRKCRPPTQSPQPNPTPIIPTYHLLQHLIQSTHQYPHNESLYPQSHSYIYTQNRQKLSPTATQQLTLNN